MWLIVAYNELTLACVVNSSVQYEFTLACAVGASSRHEFTLACQSHISSCLLDTKYSDWVVGTFLCLIYN